ncbi:MAG: LLM class F420-dependent oxidoreductase [Acidimicrobiales bacterium]
MRLGVTIPFAAPLAEHEPLIARLLDSGFTDLWTAETAGTDAFGPLLISSNWAPGAFLGTAVASLFSRGPALLAMNIATLAETAPERTIIGIGVSSKTMVEDWNDANFYRPRSRTVDTVRFLRSALRGDRIDATYDTFEVKRFQLERVPQTVPPILVAALGRRMIEAAASVADGVVLNWLSAGDVTRVKQVLDEHRDEGQDAQVAARIFVCVSEDSDAVRSAAATLVARYLTVPGYAAYHRWLGRTEALFDLWHFWAAGDRAAATASIPAAVTDDLILHGTAAQCAAQIAQYVSNGVTIPIVKMLPLIKGADLCDDAAAVAREYQSL